MLIPRAIAAFIWRHLAGRRGGTLAACVLIPAVGLFLMTFKEQTVPRSSFGQRLGFAGLGAGFGFIAYFALAAREWLASSIAQRRNLQKSTTVLVMSQVALYVFVFPILLIVLLFSLIDLLGLS